MRRSVQLQSDLPAVCRLGLATRGNTHLRPQDIEHAIERGINYLNWCGKPDGLSRTVAALGERRQDVVFAVQFKATDGEKAAREFDWILDQIKSDYLDIATFYYIESKKEWENIIGPDGAWRTLAERKRQGSLRMIGLTSHQRTLASGWAEAVEPDTGARRLDMLMIRYNAAHRGAEEDIFPVSDRLGMPVVTFTGLRWKDLLAGTADDPEGLTPPSALDCYRFCLADKSVAVTLMAPGNRAQLEENLLLLDDWKAPSSQEMKSIREHGDRVRKNARDFW